MTQSNVSSSVSRLLDYCLYFIYLYFLLQEGGDLLPTNENGKLQYSDVDYVDTWKAMEVMVKKGLTKSIGISNFNKRQVERVLEVATIKPVTNQVNLLSYKVFVSCNIEKIT